MKREENAMDRRLTVLNAMNTITRSTEMEEFLRMVGLTSTELLKMLKELAQDGFVVKTGKGYAIAEKGKLALTALTLLPDDKAFHFYVGIGQPAGVSARNVKEFYDIVKTVDAVSLEFHLEREDFENWVETAVGDDVFARELAGLRQEGLKGEALRKQILLGLETRFGEDVLRREWAY
jgi:DNA-binding Lrp family transcriptional regulator